MIDRFDADTLLGHVVDIWGAYSAHAETLRILLDDNRRLQRQCDLLIRRLSETRNQ